MGLRDAWTAFLRPRPGGFGPVGQPGQRGDLTLARDLQPAVCRPLTSRFPADQRLRREVATGDGHSPPLVVASRAQSHCAAQPLTSASADAGTHLSRSTSARGTTAAP
jgi:hypothetical protein